MEVTKNHAKLNLLKYIRMKWDGKLHALYDTSIFLVLSFIDTVTKRNKMKCCENSLNKFTRPSTNTNK